jgi:hypothetical protein
MLPDHCPVLAQHIMHPHSTSCTHTQARMLEKGSRAHDLFPPRGPRMREACHAADRPSYMVCRRPHEDLDRGRVAVARVEVASVKQAYGFSGFSCTTRSRGCSDHSRPLDGFLFFCESGVLFLCKYCHRCFHFYDIWRDEEIISHGRSATSRR